MPGLFGVIAPGYASLGSHQEELASIARGMATAMRYEESYVETLLTRPDLGVHVGSVALADANRSARPTSNERPTVLVTGEAAAQPKGLTGEEIVQSVAGKYAAFIFDPSSGKCFLCNDRYGRERIFLHRDGERTLFSSEAKAILAVAPKTRAFDAVGLAEFMAWGCTLGAHSLYRDIEVLQPGTVITFDQFSTPSSRRHWTPEELETLEPLDASRFVESLSDVLRITVNKFVMDSPPVGISLTGGLDSRMVMASLEAAPNTVPCYTFGSMYRDTSDVSTARMVAARCGQPHSVIELGQNFVKGLPEIFDEAVYVSDGYIGLSGAAELYVNRKARAIAPARMTGNWGGELTRGVGGLKYEMPKGGFILPELTKQIAESGRAHAATFSHPLSATLFQQMPLYGYGRYAIERSQLTMRTPFLSDDVVKCLYRAPASARKSSACTAAVIGRKPELLAIPTDLGLLGTGSTTFGRTFRKALVKAEYLTSHGAPDWVARVSALLPPATIETRFLGIDKFQHFRWWSRQQLAGWIRATLTNGASGVLGEWFDMTKVARMVDDHVRGRANHIDAIDKLLTLVVANRVLLGATYEARLPATKGVSVAR